MLASIYLREPSIPYTLNILSYYLPDTVMAYYVHLTIHRYQYKLICIIMASCTLYHAIINMKWDVEYKFITIEDVSMPHN